MKKSDKLLVVWTSGDREVALNMVHMYTLNAKIHNWWDEITLVIWGPSAKLLSEDEDIKDYIKKMIDVGINVEACKVCADNYNASEKLEELGVKVKYMGQPLTSYIKDDWKTITF